MRVPGLPEGATFEELQAWARQVWAPWWERASARERDRAYNGRQTGLDKRLAEIRAARLAEFAAYVAAQEKAGARGLGGGRDAGVDVVLAEDLGDPAHRLWGHLGG